MTQALASKTTPNKKPKLNANFPTRTREHHIADLSLNFIEHLVLLNGWTVEGPRRDYGYDLLLSTYDYKGDKTFQAGEFEPGTVFIQLKATDKLKTVSKGQSITYKISIEHINLWKAEPMPVFLIVYDVAKNEAYWLYMQKYITSISIKLNPKQRSITVRVPKINTVNTATIQNFRDIKHKIIIEINKVVPLHV